MVPERAVARLKGDMRPRQQQAHVADSGRRNLRLHHPEPGVVPEDEFRPRVEEDAGRNGALGVVVNLDFLDIAGLETPVHDLGGAFDDVLAGCQRQRHGHPVIGRLLIRIERKDVAACDLRGVLQRFRGMEQDAAFQQRGQRLDLDLQVRQFAADLDAAGVRESAPLLDKVAEAGLDESIDQDTLVVQLVALDLAYLDIPVVNAGTDLNRPESLGPDVDMQTRCIRGDGGWVGKTLERLAGVRGEAGPDADIAAGEDRLQSLHRACRQHRADNPEHGVFHQVLGGFVIDLGDHLDLVVAEVGMQLLDQADRNASGHDLGLVGHNARGILEGDGDFRPGIDIGGINQPAADRQGD
ncbi:MAG: hypothetical protein ACD_75C01289G0001, partial [uncultured bacterium]